MEISRHSSTLFAYAIALLPAIILPFVAVAPAGQKGPIALIALSLGLVLIGISVGRGGAEFSIPRSLPPYSGGALFISAVVSMLLSVGSVQSMMFGTSLEVGTACSVALLMIAVLVGVSVRGTHVVYVPYVFATSVIVAGAVAAIALFFSADAENGFIVGTASQLPYMVLAALLLSATSIDVGYRGHRVFAIGATAILAALTIAAHDRIAAMIGLVCLLAAAGCIAYVRRGYLPWASVIVAGFVAVVLIWGPAGMPAPTNAAKPSPLATSLVLGNAYADSIRALLIGEGPHMFSYAWSRFRTPVFNDGPFWSVTPESGNATVMTFAVLFGVVGICSLMLIPVAIFAAMYTAMRTDHWRDHQAAALPFSIVALFVTLLGFVSWIELPLFLYGGLSAGIAIGLLTHSDIGMIRVTLPRTPVVSVFCAACIIIVGVSLGQIGVRQLMAADLYQRGHTIFSTDPEAGLRYLERAYRTWDEAYYARAASDGYLAVAEFAAKSGDAPASRSLMDRSAQLAGSATDSDKSDFEAWFTRARVEVAQIIHGYVQDPARANEALQQAQSLSRFRPDVLYERAKLELARGDKAAAREDLELALRLKPDYPEATALMRRFTVSATD